MSRREMENVSFMVAFGADSMTGSFIQVWRQPHGESDCPLVVVDNRGVVVMDERGLAKTPLGLRQVLAEVGERFQIAKGRGNAYPNVDGETMVRIAKAVGFSDMEELIYEELD